MNCIENSRRLRREDVPICEDIPSLLFHHGWWVLGLGHQQVDLKREQGHAHSYLHLYGRRRLDDSVDRLAESLSRAATEAAYTRCPVGNRSSILLSILSAVDSASAITASNAGERGGGFNWASFLAMRIDAAIHLQIYHFRFIFAMRIYFREGANRCRRPRNLSVRNSDAEHP
jgi:hypothetical protein